MSLQKEEAHGLPSNMSKKPTPRLILMKFQNMELNRDSMKVKEKIMYNDCRPKWIDLCTATLNTERQRKGTFKILSVNYFYIEFNIQPKLQSSKGQTKDIFGPAKSKKKKLPPICPFSVSYWMCSSQTREETNKEEDMRQDSEHKSFH